MPALTWSDTTDNVGSIFDHLAGVEGSFCACEALDDDARVLVDEYTHGVAV